MPKTCEYVWKTTAKKGQKCGRKISNGTDDYCYQHKPVVKKETNNEPPGKSVFLQLANSQAPPKQVKKKKVSSSSSMESSTSSSSSSSLSSSSDSSSLSSD